MEGDFRIDQWLVQPQLDSAVSSDNAEAQLEPKAMEVLVWLPILCSLLLVSVQPSLAPSIPQDWLHTPLLQWSLLDVEEILTDSPWVDLSLIGGARRADATFLKITSQRFLIND